MTWEEDEATVTHRMMQFADECIETKTVTTTTTTKRSYPPLFLREPRDVHSLDPKEYPLASKPTPPELRSLTFEVYNHEPGLWEPAGPDIQVSRGRRRVLCFLRKPFAKKMSSAERATTVSEHRLPGRSQMRARCR